MRLIAKLFVLLAFFSMGVISVSWDALAQEKDSAQPKTMQLIIAVVDISKIQAAASAPVAMRKQINEKRKVYQAEMQKEENILREGQAELTRQRAILSPEALKSEREKFQEKFVAAQRKIQERKAYLDKARVAASEKINSSLKEVLEKIVNDNQITLLLRKEVTVMSAKQLDITNVVIKELNAILPSVVVFPDTKGKK